MATIHCTLSLRALTLVVFGFVAAGCGASGGTEHDFIDELDAGELDGSLDDDASGGSGGSGGAGGAGGAGGSEEPDASVEDAGPDAAEPGDAGSGDAEAPSDAGDEPDVGGGDAGRDAASGDADGEGDELDPDVEAIIGGGYSCRAAGGVADRGSLAAALMLAGAVLARRRRA